MKILQINSVCGIGSTGRIVTDLYGVLEQHGHDCLIGYGRGRAPDGLRTIKIGSNFDVYSHVLKTRLFDKHGFGSVHATQKFIHTIEKYNPDLVQLHNIHGYYINVEILFNYLKTANKPVVWTFHDSWAFTGHCACFDSIGCERWKTGCHSCAQKLLYPKSIFLNNSGINYKYKKSLFSSVRNLTIITPSRWLAGLAEQSFLGTFPVEVINNGIDLSKFKPTKENILKKYNLKGKFIILGVASVWNDNKGLRYFIEMSKKLNSQYQIVLVGINAKIKKTLPENIIGIQKTTNVSELAGIYTAATVFVNPTLDDNFPTTNLEALACGTPVITFNTGGSAESIDEKSGIVVEKKNLDELITAVTSVYDKNFKEDNCIKKSQAYDKNIIFYKYLKLYLAKVNNT